ncbi:MCE family protein [Nocardia sp. FBN12]|uniref:MCE family protein n=1 Tax=Nocardia sp. FBN12 TaxID=3419766 RepID=UPI003CFBF0E0
MMRTRLVRGQLIVFAVLAVASLVYGLVHYVSIQRLTGIGTYTVTAEFTEAGGIYEDALVTYRGLDIGRVTGIELNGTTVEVRLQLESDYRVPASTTATIKSMSAVGEQYLDLQPDTNSQPYLADGSRIAKNRTAVPVPTGQVLGNLQTLLTDIRTESLNNTIDEVAAALDGTGPALSGLIESSADLIRLAQADLGPTVQLINDAESLLTTGNVVGSDIRSFTHDLASFSQQLVLNDTQIRGILDEGPPAADTVGGTFADLSEPLPLLLTDLQTVGQVLRVNLPQLRQIMVVYPALSAVVNNSAVGYSDNSDPQLPLPLDIKLGNTLNPPPCTEGYQGTQRRDPSDTAPLEVTPNQHCDVLPENPKVARGARNLPCATDPTVRTADVANCPRGLPSTWSDMPQRPGVVEPAPPAQPQAAPTAAADPVLSADNPAAVPYAELSGIFRGPDGITYVLGNAPSVSGKEVMRWQSLLIK